MADDSFSTQGVIIAQNAGTTAATIYAALVAAGQVDGWVPEVFEEIRNDIFNGAQAVATAAETIEVFGGKEERYSGGGKSGGGWNKGGGNRGGSGGGRSWGGNRGGSGGGRESDKDAADLEFRNGKNAGKTISQVFDEDPDYLYWAAENLQNAFMKKKVQEFLQNVEG